MARIQNIWTLCLHSPPMTELATCWTKCWGMSKLLSSLSFLVFWTARETWAWIGIKLCRDDTYSGFSPWAVSHPGLRLPSCWSGQFAAQSRYWSEWTRIPCCFRCHPTQLKKGLLLTSIWRQIFSWYDSSYPWLLNIVLEMIQTNRITKHVPRLP